MCKFPVPKNVLVGQKATFTNDNTVKTRNKINYLCMLLLMSCEWITHLNNGDENNTFETSNLRAVQL